MVKTTVKIEGMACPMCEAHVSEAIRKNVPGAKKVAASHTDGEAVFETETAPDPDAVRKLIGETGYKYISMSSEDTAEKRRFSLFGKK